MKIVGVDGTSSDEEVVGEDGVKFFVVAEKPWRSGELNQFMARLSLFCEKRKTETRGHPARFRRRDVDEELERVSTSVPKRPGLWKNCFKEAYLEDLTAWHREKLKIKEWRYDFSFPDWFIEYVPLSVKGGTNCC